MDFTKEELFILSEGVLKLIDNAVNAQKLVSSEEAQAKIKEYMGNLRILNDKICQLNEVPNEEKANSVEPGVLQNELKEKLEEHVNEICVEFQQKMGITSGDIAPSDVLELDAELDMLTKRLAIILLKQPRKE